MRTSHRLAAVIALTLAGLTACGGEDPLALRNGEPAEVGPAVDVDGGDTAPVDDVPVDTLPGPADGATADPAERDTASGAPAPGDASEAPDPADGTTDDPDGSGPTDPAAETEPDPAGDGTDESSEPTTGGAMTADEIAALEAELDAIDQLLQDMEASFAQD